jgi:hypothetical protein
MKPTLKTLLALLLFAAGLPARAQKETWKERYPAAEAVYSRISCDISFRYEKDHWVALNDFSEDLVYLSDNAVKMLSRGHIFHSGFNELKKWDAFVQPLESKKVKAFNATTASSRQDYVFYDDTKQTSFDYGAGAVGATRHLDFRLQHNDIKLLSPHYFERYFPVAEAIVTITVPEEMRLKYLIKGLQAEKVTVSETKKKDRTIYTFVTKDLKGLTSYDDAPDNAYYATHLIYYIEQIRENGEWKPFLSGPRDLYRHSYAHIRNLNREPGTALKELTDSLLRNAGTQEEKARRIYSWVQSHIKYVAFEDGMEGFVPRDANLVYSRRFGDCKDMTAILTVMLNYAGIPAYFTWIGTRDIPYDYTEVPLPIVDNHMICTIRLGDRLVYLDGTDESCIFGRPPHSIQGKQAMISISDTAYRIERVPVVPKDENVLNDSTFLYLQGKDLAGRIKVTLTGYGASELITYLNYRNEQREREEFLKSRFTRGSNKISFTNWKIEVSPRRDSVQVSANLLLPDYARLLGSEAFVNLNLFRWFEHREIDYPKRQLPIEFPYLNRSSFAVVLQIPEGYQLSHLPSGEKYSNAVWGFHMQYGSSQNAVWLSHRYDTDQLLLQPEGFQQWNAVLEHLYPHYKQTIALSKK